MADEAVSAYTVQVIIKIGNLIDIQNFMNLIVISVIVCAKRDRLAPRFCAYQESNLGRGKDYWTVARRQAQNHHGIDL